MAFVFIFMSPSTGPQVEELSKDGAKASRVQLLQNWSRVPAVRQSAFSNAQERPARFKHFQALLHIVEDQVLILAA